MDADKINNVVETLLRKIIDEKPNLETLVFLRFVIAKEMSRLINWKYDFELSNQGLNYGNQSEQQILAELETSVKAFFGDNIPKI